MSTEILILLVTGAIAAIGVVVYLWTAGASLLMAIEIHLLRVETHRLRIEYARRIAELTGQNDSDIIEVGEAEEAAVDDPQAETATDHRGTARKDGSAIAGFAREAAAMRAAA